MASFGGVGHRWEAAVGAITLTAVLSISPAAATTHGDALTAGAASADRPVAHEPVTNEPVTDRPDAAACRAGSDEASGPSPAEAPANLTTALATFLGDSRVGTRASGVSVWIDGYGEVLAHEPDTRLAPASNQKLFTAMSALEVLGPQTRLVTSLIQDPGGALVVVGGNDPTITTSGSHSLAELARQARAAGLTRATELVVDESRGDGSTRASGWQDWQIPTYTGPLSSFMVDGNRARTDPIYVADPARAHGEQLVAALRAAGVAVDGPVRAGTLSAPGEVVALLESAPVSELVRRMLERSDNQIADALLPAVGQARLGEASMRAGAATGTAVLAYLCVPLVGRTDDGSGLSRSDQRSPREWRSLVQAAPIAPWWPTLEAGLPLAARTGTLSGRFGGTAAADNVRAKTGTIIGGTALSGTGTTAGGRAFVFSVIVNGPNGEGAVGAIDRLVATIAAHAG